jgi:hypothetical protein
MNTWWGYLALGVVTVLALFNFRFGWAASRRFYRQDESQAVREHRALTHLVDEVRLVASHLECIRGDMLASTTAEAMRSAVNRAVEEQNAYRREELLAIGAELKRFKREHRRQNDDRAND